MADISFARLDQVTNQTGTSFIGASGVTTSYNTSTGALTINGPAASAGNTSIAGSGIVVSTTGSTQTINAIPTAQSSVVAGSGIVVSTVGSVYTVDAIGTVGVAGSGITISTVGTTQTVNSNISSTSNVPEGSNLYYTSGRVDSEIASMLTAGSGIVLSNNPANKLTINYNDQDLAGSGITVSVGPSNAHTFNSSISYPQASGLTSGTDTFLHYHSQDRNRAVHTGLQLSSTISDFTAAVDTEFDTRLAAKSTTNLIKH